MKRRTVIGFTVIPFFILFLFAAVLSGDLTVSHPASVSAEDTSVRIPADIVEAPVGITVPDESELLYENLPQYTGEPGISINDGEPLFTEDEIDSVTGVIYSDLDDLGRCGPAVGLIGPETIPDVTRESIGDVRPSGWHTVRYDDRIEDRYLYNRCHLIGYQLAGANAEPRNLITGTRYLNIEGMLPYENAVLAYIMRTGNHVLYRVTPVFEEDDLIASGVVLEAYSVEDSGEGLQFCEYLFNVQPGVIIDYKTGDSQKDDSYVVMPEETEPLIFVLPEQESGSDIPDRSIPVTEDTDEEEFTYVLNTNTMRFHDPSCPSVEEMKAKNRAYSTESREELIAEGYIPCGRCKP